MELKKIGIVVDDYKVEKFKAELKEKGITEFKSFPFAKNTTAFTFEVPESEFKEKAEMVRRLCRKLEYHFKRSN